MFIYLACGGVIFVVLFACFVSLLFSFLLLVCHDVFMWHFPIFEQLLYCKQEYAVFFKFINCDLILKVKQMLRSADDKKTFLKAIMK